MVDGEFIRVPVEAFKALRDGQELYRIAKSNCADLVEIDGERVRLSEKLTSQINAKGGVYAVALEYLEGAKRVSDSLFLSMYDYPAKRV